MLIEDEHVMLDDFEEASSDVGLSDQVYHTAVTSLNIEQRQLFNKVANKLLNNDSTDDKLLQVFVTSGARSGKTFVLKLLVEQIRRLTQNNRGRCVIVTAPTRVVARLIGESTLLSTFALPFELPFFH